MSAKGSIQVRFCVFLDVVGFESIPDFAMKPFVEDFLKPAAQSLEREGTCPLFVNTWGDAVLLVFDKAGHAGLAALKLQQFVQNTPIALPGRSRKLTLRIGIHGGPMWEGVDPFTNRPTFLGKNINRAARIEPIAEEGQIFVSQEFAALCEFEGVTSFRCIPQGLADLPKQSGRILIYRLVSSET